MNLKGTKISDLRISFEVRTCAGHVKVREAVELMKTMNIGSVVIVGPSGPGPDQAALGIFTERDVLQKLVLQPPESWDEPITRFMTPDPKWVGLDDSIYKAALYMRVGRFRHLLVKDRDSRVVGVLSIKDLLDWVVDHFS